MTTEQLEAIKQRHRDAASNPRTYGSAAVYGLVMDDMPALMAEVERLRDALEVIEAAVVDGRASLDVWGLMDIATKALKG